jgi:hypothetical protein
MRKYIKYSFITITCIVLADIAAGIVFDYLSTKQKSNFIFEMRYKLNQANPDVFIIGSSRAAHHYNSSTIQQKTGLRTINYGIDGTDLFMDYVFMSHLVKKCKGTETFVVDINMQDLETQQLAYSYITRLYPLASEVDEVRENANRYSKYEKIKLLSNAYRYNDYAITLLNGLYSGKKDTAAITGFRPIHHKMVQQEKVVLRVGNTNTEALDYLNKITSLCKQKNVRLVIAISPAYASNIKSTNTYKTLEIFTKENNIPFLYYGDFEKTLDPMNFSDYSHLNAEGAYLFSNQVAKDLDSILRK